ncbi:hypothetical protein A4A49_29873 [Nicotiana attenuata]|uniref:Uncharacterized protein n=1 Tax=Nicotiana attenuata TaxID=49451 RepID=A0A1J6JA31_NICAT|nr:hypothetical protein A4A49_29873 [Nicotiana attenuata]
MMMIIMIMKKEDNNKPNGRNNRAGLSTVGTLVSEVNENDDSDYDESDELLEDGTDKEDEVEVIYQEYDKKTDNLVLELGVKFGTFKQFKQACMNWRINKRRQLYFKSNNTKEVFVYAGRKGVPLELGQVQDDPSWDIKGLLAIVQNNLGYIIHRMKAFRSKELALKWGYGDEAHDRGRLQDHEAVDYEVYEEANSVDTHERSENSVDGEADATHDKPVDDVVNNNSEPAEDTHAVTEGEVALDPTLIEATPAPTLTDTPTNITEGIIETDHTTPTLRKSAIIAKAPLWLQDFVAS